MTLAQARTWAKERRRQAMMEASVLGWMGITLEDLDPLTIAADGQGQPVGQACEGKLITLCRDAFEDKLLVACRSCPGPTRSRCG
jgi:hypothetical protein